MKIKITYYKSKCIKNGSCLRFVPNLFSIQDEKLYIQDMQSKEDYFFIIKEFDEMTVKKLINAAMSCPVNALMIRNLESGEELSSSKIRLDKDYMDIEAKYNDLEEFVMDPKGYFLIRIDTKTQLIEAAFCDKINHIKLRVFGKTPIDIYQTIIKNNLVSRFDHAAYLGRELQKAHIALKKNWPYVQDDELIL
jgi:ferredoxin